MSIPRAIHSSTRGFLAALHLLRLALREARASAPKFAFVVAAVAIGVGALSGVQGFSRAFTEVLLRDARQLLAADIAIRIFYRPQPHQQEILEEIQRRGARMTHITETVSMMSRGGGQRPLLVSVKAVDPAVYPFYGQIQTRPPASLPELLSAGGMAVSEDLLLRLGAAVGDTLRLGDAEFRVNAVITVEPDRMTGTLNVGPRAMISREGLGRTGLVRLGSRAAQRYLFQLPAEGLGVEEVRRLLEDNFSGGRVGDFREVHPTIRRGLDRAIRFLSLVSLVALVIGALGVGMAMHAHLQQRLDTIAIMKCLGGRSRTILGIYLSQTLAIALAGGLLGAGLGYFVQLGGPLFIAAYFPELPRLEWQPVSAVQGVLIGVLTTLLFTLPPLLGIRRVRPALIFRREMERGPKSPGQWISQRKEALAAGALILTGLATVAAWLSDSTELGLWFAGGLLVSTAAMAVTAGTLLRLLRRIPGWLPVRLPTALRHGIANLHRPGVHAEVILVALGVGVTFTLAVYLIQNSVVTSLSRSAPPDMPNLFLVNVTDAEKPGLEKLINEHPGVAEEAEFYPSVAAALVMVDGVPIEELAQEGPARRYLRTRSVTWTEERPEGVEIVRGQWWPPSGESDPPEDAGVALVAAEQDAAEALRFGLGSVLEWQIGGRRLRARVCAIHRGEPFRMGNSEFLFPPEALAGLPALYYGGVRVAPDQLAELQRKAYDLFPSVSLINVADVLKIVQTVVDQISLVVQYIAVFVIAAGLVILSSSVVATRLRRIQETAILKTLGATRARITRIYSTEFLLLGAVAGLIGGLLASGFAAVLLEQVLESEYHFAWGPIALTIAATAALANVAGWAASFPILGKRPLEVLRAE